MIINYPTGLYVTVLPKGTESGNVTFTISNNPPPRTNLLFPKVPQGIIERQRVPKALDRVVIRQSLGVLVFSVSRASRTIEGNSSRQYEIGQVLEFSDIPTQTLDPMFVSPITETRHDTNVFDYTSLGITEEEQQTINDSALLVHDQLLTELNLVRIQRADAEREINSQQKIINEAQRNIAAMQVIISTSASTDADVESLLEKFEAKLQSATEARDAAGVVANEAAAEASALEDQIRTIATVVK